MCPFCFATESYYFDGEICRRCLPYRSGSVVERDIAVGEVSADLSIKLTESQSQVALELIHRCFESHVCVEAVCGAGKTEMCVPLIEYCLKYKKRIGWATPRKQIVIELSERLQRYFPKNKVVSVYGTHTDVLSGDLVVCTTHQIFRYHNYFDILILDEPDAFPFKGNLLLCDLLRASLRGNCVFLSATFDDQQFSHFGAIHKISVNKRPSNEPLAVPKITMSLTGVLRMLYRLRHEKVLLFVPTIKQAQMLSICLQSPCVTSKTADAQKIIEEFRNKESGILVTTTVLERGVTFIDCFVVVYDAGHSVFDEASLIQIAGRVRRGMNPKKGACLFYVKEKSVAVELCIKRIQAANAAGFASVN